jgi:hypothetical protein
VLTCDTPAKAHIGPVRPYPHGDRCDSHRPGRGGGRCLPAGPVVPVTVPMTFAQPAAGIFRPPGDPVATSVIDTVKRAAAHAPRSMQAAVGPSELGTPCRRKLAYKVLDWPAKPNSDTDPWASVIGTATHAWLADTYGQENQRLFSEARDRYVDGHGARRNRYLIEHRVHLPGGISGSCDLFDRDTGDVIDWKITGLPRLKEYRKNGPGQQYRVQAHLYGFGMQLAGETVKRVADVFLPRGGRIDMLYVWSEPYDPQVAVEALKRYQAIRDFHATVNPEQHPDRWQLLPTADAHCTYCPFYLPGSADLSKGCPGHQATAPKGK